VLAARLVSWVWYTGRKWTSNRLSTGQSRCVCGADVWCVL